MTTKKSTTRKIDGASKRESFFLDQKNNMSCFLLGSDLPGNDLASMKVPIMNEKSNKMILTKDEEPEFRTFKSQRNIRHIEIDEPMRATESSLRKPMVKARSRPKGAYVT